MFIAYSLFKTMCKKFKILVDIQKILQNWQRCQKIAFARLQTIQATTNANICTFLKRFRNYCRSTENNNKIGNVASP